MFRKIGDGLRRFMYGRYGTDKLNTALLISTLALLLIGWLGGRFLSGWLQIFSLLAYVPLIWSIIRTYSRNIDKRRRENAAYLGFVNRLKDRDNRYFRCPKCRQRVRVPRGKGKIAIRCPKCSERFVRKT